MFKRLFLSALFPSALAHLANELDDGKTPFPNRDFAQDAPDDSAATLANALAESGDEEEPKTWILLFRYGTLPHKQGKQVFERADAEALANEFHGVFGSLRRFLGIPWYIGHPDHEAFRDRYKDTRAYGRVKRLRAGAEGLEAKVRFNAEGRALIANEAFDGHSVNWECQFVEARGGWVPRRLKSVGFTNSPNLRDLPPITLAMANATNPNPEQPNRTEPKNTMLQFIKELLISRGRLKPGAPDDAVSGALETLANDADALPAATAKASRAGLAFALLRMIANEAVANVGEKIREALETFNADAEARGAMATTPADLAAKVGIDPAAFDALLSGAIGEEPGDDVLRALADALGVAPETFVAVEEEEPEAEPEAEEEEEMANEADQRFQAERRGRAESVVALAVAEGRLIPSRREAAVAELANVAGDFDEAASRLFAGAGGIKVAAKTDGVAARAPKEASQADEIRALANEIMAVSEDQSSAAFDRAWATAKKQVATGKA